MTRNDLAKVAAWLQSKGLTVNETARGRNRVFFTGTVAQIGTLSAPKSTAMRSMASPISPTRRNSPSQQLWLIRY
jgi:hypothetical protein